MSSVASPSLSASPRGHAFSGVFLSLEAHMAQLDAFLHGQLAAFEPEVRGMVDYCIDTSGKRIRPALVFVSGCTKEGEVSPLLVRAAAVVELVHLATLVHDDIMDGADIRRARRTAARELGITPAVLLGDALFAHALHLATQFPTTEVCAAVSESTRRVCAGEIMQTLRRRSPDVSLADYRRIIDLKTAELFRVSCFLGARLAGYNQPYVDAVAHFGRRLGIAYQIYDDLADFFGDESQIGKTLGTDLASGKLTLPLFALLERFSESERLDLGEEIAGHAPARTELRRSQMRDLGVFGVVADAIFKELDEAARGLQEQPDFPPTARLIGLCEVLRGQVESLRP